MEKDTFKRLVNDKGFLTFIYKYKYRIRINTLFKSAKESINFIVYDHGHHAIFSSNNFFLFFVQFFYDNDDDDDNLANKIDT